MKQSLYKSLLWIFLLFSISSCSPVYKVAHDFQPPSTPKGLSCLRGCQAKLKQCNQQCGMQYQQCSVKANAQAKKNLPKLLREYPQKLEQWLNARDRYQRDLEWYEFRLEMAEVRRDQSISHCIKQGKKRKSCSSSYPHPLTNFSYSRPSFNTPRPKRPTLNGEASRIRKLSCNTNCGCQSSYRLCYASCGGVVKSKKICIKNCGN